MDKITLVKVLNKFRNKRVFITGHTGFKGSWLTMLLKQLGAQVRGYALEPVSSPNHFDLLDINNDIDHIIGDIRDYSNLKASMQSFKPEFVFHLAAQALVIRSYEDPVDTFSTNIMGSNHLLESVRDCNSVKSLVYITSDKCYENLEWEYGYRENDKLGGHDPYSASKAAAEILFSTYQRSFFSQIPELGVGSARAGNVIGGGDWSLNRIIPDCIRSIESNEPIILRNPSAIRPWQHVLEPLTGYLYLAYALCESPDRFSGSWNFGPKISEVRTVEEVAKNIIEYYGKGKIRISNTSNKQHESQLLQLNCDKANQNLNWNPKWDIQDTIKFSAEWYKSFYDNQMANAITSKQISNYFNGAL